MFVAFVVAVNNLEVSWAQFLDEILVSVYNDIILLGQHS